VITKGDAARILSKCAAYDQRTIGDADVAAWHEALNLANPPITAADALTAIAAWHAESVDDRRIRIAHIIQGAQRIAYRRAGAERAAKLAEQLALETAETEDRTEDRDELLAKLAEKFGSGDPAVLRRREWVAHERRQRLAKPNPHFTGFPPPGGFPVPDADSA
jgi:hypothetical protein